MKTSNHLKIKKVLIIAIIGVIVLGGLFTIPATRTWIRKPVTIRKAAVRSMDTAFLKFKEAERSRIPAEMFIQAKTVQAEDAELGALMYKRCALFAALQQNKEQFAEVLAVYPDAKSLECFFVANEAPARSLLPQVVMVSSLAEARQLPESQLATWGEFIASCYEDMSTIQAEGIATLVNEAREQLSEAQIFEAAVGITQFKAKSDIPVQFTVRQLVKETVDLAEIHSNIDVLTKIVDQFKNKNILEAKELAAIEASSKALAATRGSRYNDWDDDCDSSYSRGKPKNFAIPIALFIVAFFVLVILYYTLQILFGLAVIICIIAVIAAFVS